MFLNPFNYNPFNSTNNVPYPQNTAPKSLSRLNSIFNPNLNAGYPANPGLFSTFNSLNQLVPQNQYSFSNMYQTSYNAENYQTFQQRQEIYTELKQLANERTKIIPANTDVPDNIDWLKSQIDENNNFEKTLLNNLANTYPDGSSSVDTLVVYNDLKDVEYQKIKIKLDIYKLEADRIPAEGQNGYLDTSSQDYTNYNKNLSTIKQRLTTLNANYNRYNTQSTRLSKMLNSSIPTTSTLDQKPLKYIKDKILSFASTIDLQKDNAQAPIRNTLRSQFISTSRTLPSKIPADIVPDSTQITTFYTKLDEISISKIENIKKIRKTYPIDSPQDKLLGALERLIFVNAYQHQVKNELYKSVAEIGALGYTNVDAAALENFSAKVTSQNTIVEEYKANKTAIVNLNAIINTEISRCPAVDRTNFAQILIQNVTEDSSILDKYNTYNTKLVKFSSRTVTGATDPVNGIKTIYTNQDKLVSDILNLDKETVREYTVRSSLWRLASQVNFDKLQVQFPYEDMI